MNSGINYQRRYCTSYTPNTVITVPISRRQLQFKNLFISLYGFFSYLSVDCKTELLEKCALLVKASKDLWLIFPFHLIYKKVICQINTKSARGTYCGPTQKIISRNLLFALDHLKVLNANLEEQFIKKIVAQIYKQGSYFITSSLGLVPKPNHK